MDNLCLPSKLRTDLSGKLNFMMNKQCDGDGFSVFFLFFNPPPGLLDGMRNLRLLRVTPHIVQVDEFSDLFAFRLIDNGPASYILSFKNQDRPGAISEVLYVQ